MALTLQQSIDELDAFFGVTEPVAAKPLVRLHTTGRLEALIAGIAEHMRLPVEFKLSVVSGNTRFQSHYLARTDRSGRGSEGIEAQVNIPTNLPLFGSAELRRYPIGVLITPAFRTARPETAITILAHELSHVLLHSLRHPERDSEVLTDLVPIVLGFAEIVQRGRRVSLITHDGNIMRTTTITYGYLSDADFASALEQVDSLLSARRTGRLRLLKDIARLRLTATRAGAAVTRFGELKQRLDTKIGCVRSADAERVVALHAADYTVAIEGAIRRAVDVAAKAESFGDSVTQYPKHMLAELDEYEQQCASAAARLDAASRELKKDLALLARHCGVRYRLREALTALTAGWPGRESARRRSG